MRNSSLVEIISTVIIKDRDKWEDFQNDNKARFDQLMSRYAEHAKIQMTQRRIEEWVYRFGEDGVYVSFSGGKDSTVLLDIARKLYPDLKAMFVDVPTQYVELREFVKSFDNVDIVKPKISFMEVCESHCTQTRQKRTDEHDRTA